MIVQQELKHFLISLKINEEIFKNWSSSVFFREERRKIKNLKNTPGISWFLRYNKENENRLAK